MAPRLAVHALQVEGGLELGNFTLLFLDTKPCAMLELGTMCLCEGERRLRRAAFFILFESPFSSRPTSRAQGPSRNNEKK